MKKTILKFAEVAIQPSKLGKLSDSNIKRAIGYVALSSFLPVIELITLDSNPRNAKRNNIVSEIIGSIDNSPDLLRFKSKGILMASADVDELDRGRFRLSLQNSSIEGVLDGGHNTMAFCLYVLRDYLKEKDFNKIRDWASLKEAWDSNSTDILAHAEKYEDIFLSLELLYPIDKSEEAKADFEEALFEISDARNNNTQLSDEAFQNHMGLYENFKVYLPSNYSDRVVWKPGQSVLASGKTINPRDLVALFWIPANMLNQHKLLPYEVSVTPQNIYRNKGECSDKFGKLMRDNSVTQPTGGVAGQQRHLVHEGIESAIKLACDIPELFDEFYAEFPTAYNKGGNKFGARNVVKMYDPEKVKLLRLQGKDHSNYTSSKPTKPFSGESSTQMVHKYPEAFIVPFVTSLHVFMEVKDGKVKWKSPNYKSEILTKFKEKAPRWSMALELSSWDPQKLAKNATSHDYAADLMSL